MDKLIYKELIGGTCSSIISSWAWIDFYKKVLDN